MNMYYIYVYMWHLLYTYLFARLPASASATHRGDTTDAGDQWMRHDILPRRPGRGATCPSPPWPTRRRGGDGYGQFSKVQSGEMGPAPGIFELSKGILKWTWAMILGFETLDWFSSKSNLWELTVCTSSLLTEGFPLLAPSGQAPRVGFPTLGGSLRARRRDVGVRGPKLTILVWKPVVEDRPAYGRTHCMVASRTVRDHVFFCCRSVTQRLYPASMTPGTNVCILYTYGWCYFSL